MKKITIEEVISEILEGGINKYGINKSQYLLIQNYKNQTYIKKSGGIGIIKLDKFIQVIPKIKNIRLLTLNTGK